MRGSCAPSGGHVSRRRGIEIAAVVAVGAAFIGLFVGVRVTTRAAAELRPSRGSSGARVVGARSYRDMQRQPADDNARLSTGWWQALEQKRPSDLAEFTAVPNTEAAREKRRARRAYEGAPPTIPHSVDQLAVPSCMTCHDAGVSVAGMAAPPMSHPPMGSCVQCHVVEAGPVPGVAVPVVDNRFVPVRENRTGQRAWTGAPPTMPHPSFMRERCEACHGVFATDGIRSSHPWRDSCTQCHPGSAEFDQRSAGLSTPRPPL